MEGLSAAASGMAIMSLTLELLGSVNTIRETMRKIKKASEEVDRLLGVLDRLGFLLDDVYRVMELQYSSADTRISSPSTTISNCLHILEYRIERLQHIIHDLAGADGRGRCSISKLRKAVKIVTRAKEITCYEIGIQHEMLALSTALAVNNTSLQISTLVAITQQNKECSASKSPFRVRSYDSMTDWNSSKGQNTLQPMIRHQCRSPESVLARIGLYTMTIMRVIHCRLVTRNDDEYGERPIIATARKYVWICRALRLGISLALEQLSGSILPTLKVFPVVPGFGNNVRELIKYGTVEEIQQGFRTGSIHPHTQDELGRTLLHVAAEYIRADVCHLLLALGVEQGFSREKETPLMWAFGSTEFLSSGIEAKIDTMRCLLQSHARIDEFIDAEWSACCANHCRHWMPELLEWFAGQWGDLYWGSELLLLRGKSLRRSLGTVNVADKWPKMRALLKRFVNTDDRKRLESGSIYLLDDVFHRRWAQNPLESFEIGDALIELMQELDINVRKFLGNELEAHPGQLLNHCDDARLNRACFLDADRQLVIEGSEKRGWVVGWKWLVDDQSPGRIVAREYWGLAASSAEHWPFNSVGSEHRTHLDETKGCSDYRDFRFQRRVAGKARRELARDGLKIRRSKMPGSWVD